MYCLFLCPITSVIEEHQYKSVYIYHIRDMKKKIILPLLLFAGLSLSANAQYTREKLNRVPVAVKSSEGILVSWRSLEDDGKETTFSISRNGKAIASEISSKTNYLDKDGKPGDVYTVHTVAGGVTKETSDATAWSNIYKAISVPRPSAIKSGDTTGRYRPDDMSIGDVDGDGEYELVLKWMPDNQRDNGTPKGYSSPCILDCYKMDGTQLWRINLGLNIRSGNHYTQFLVYDFDGDGKAEMICKTAPGSKDGRGMFVSAAASDSRIRNVDNNKACYAKSGSYAGNITTGEEFLTVFNGATGAAMHTIWYSPDRAMVDFPTAEGAYNSKWGDSNQNRGNRFNACVAYLGGIDKVPSAVFERGYYKSCYVWAVDWDGGKLSTRWLHKSVSADSWSVVDGSGKTLASGTGKSCYGQGVHGISVGDLNNDQCDEIVLGSATIAHDGSLVSSTGMGHGDAVHLADLVPSRPGLEVMMPHEESPYGYDIHDALTGEIILSAKGSKDNGRGLAADFIPASKGSEFWSSHDGVTRSCTDGSTVFGRKADTNFRIYWTGDPYDQTFDGHYDSNTGRCYPCICAYNTTTKSIDYVQMFADYGAPSTCNTTKATPCLQADILGDWREELIMYEYESDYSSSTCKILIYSTPEQTKYKVPCLMQDHLYRMGVAWQNSSYNQPPHLGYCLDSYLGVNGSTYHTSTKSHAPEPTPSEPATSGSESLAMPAADRGVVQGLCYTAGANGEITSTQSNGYIKIRTGNNDRIIFNVNDGYVITGITVSGFSNNGSTIADRSITLDGIYIDDEQTSVLASSVTFPGGTAGQSEVTASASGFEAAKTIMLVFDNTNIVDSSADSAGKNKQIMANVTFTYKLAEASAVELITLQMNTNACYDLMGRKVMNPSRGIYLKDGKKVLVK